MKKRATAPIKRESSSLCPKADVWHRGCPYAVSAMPGRWNVKLKSAVIGLHSLPAALQSGDACII